MAYTDGIAQALDGVAGLTYKVGSGGDIFVDQIPSEPDRAVCIYAMPGPEADSKLPYDPANFQIAVRSEAGGVWAAATWAAIYSKLHGMRNVTLPDGTYLVFCIATQASPFRLGTDENGRLTYTGNYRTEILNPTGERQA
jgi:hypothetical protein